MLTSCAHNNTLHFTVFRSNSLPYHRKIHIFLMHSCSRRARNVKAYMVRSFENIQKSKKEYFFFKHFFLKVKMDILFMSIFKKKDRIFTTFFPAFFLFHLAGGPPNTSKTLLSQKKSEIRICPKRG